MDMEINMRTVIRDDEDWIANPRDAVATTSMQNPGLVERLSGFAYAPGGTWDFPVDDDDPTLEVDVTPALVVSFRNKLNEQAVVCRCSHEFQEARCRCSVVVGVTCTKCEEFLCSWKCQGQAPTPADFGPTFTRTQVEFSVEHRASVLLQHRPALRGGHSQRMGRGVQLHRMEK